jgi:hypothetical protein
VAGGAGEAGRRPRQLPGAAEALRAAREELLGRLVALRARAGEQEQQQFVTLELRRASVAELKAAEQGGRRALT